MRNNPGIAQTNLLCCAKSAFFAPRSNLEETQTFLTFAWSLQASRLFARAKRAACRSWLQVCVCEFREARRRSSLVPRHSVRYTLQTRNDLQLPSLANSSLACEDRTKGRESAKRGRGLRNMSYANPGFAVQSCDPKFAQENPRMVRIRTLRITYTSEKAHCVHM